MISFLYEYHLDTVSTSSLKFICFIKINAFSDIQKKIIINYEIIHFPDSPKNLCKIEIFLFSSNSYAGKNLKKYRNGSE